MGPHLRTTRGPTLAPWTSPRGAPPPHTLDVALWDPILAPRGTPPVHPSGPHPAPPPGPLHPAGTHPHAVDVVTTSLRGTPPSQLVIPQPTPQNSPAHTPGPLPAHPAMNPTLAACWHPVGPHTCTPTPSKLSAHHPCRSHSHSPPCSLPSLTTLVRLVLVPPLGASMCRTALAAGHTTAMLAAAISRLAPDDVGSLPTSSPDVVSRRRLPCSSRVVRLSMY